MNKMKRIIGALLLLLIPIISLAQRAERGGLDPEYVEYGPAPGKRGTPIDQYEIALIIMAVSIIAYFVYRQYTAKKQA